MQANLNMNNSTRQSQMFLSEREIGTFLTADLFYQHKRVGFLLFEFSFSGTDLIEVKKELVLVVKEVPNVPRL